MSYLLDTSTVSYFFKKDPKVISRIEEVPPSQIFLSTITVMEIDYGLKLHAEREKKLMPLWTAFLSLVSLLAFCEKCAKTAAHFRAELKAAGTPVGPYDLLLAATAAANDLTIVTSNLSEFRRFPDLTVVDWRA